MKKRMISLLLMLLVAGQSVWAMEEEEPRTAEMATQIDALDEADLIVMPVVVDLNPEDILDTLSNGWILMEDTNPDENGETQIISHSQAAEFLQGLLGIDVSTPKGVAQLCTRIYAMPSVQRVGKSALTAVVTNGKKILPFATGHMTRFTTVAGLKNGAVNGATKYLIPVISGPAGKVVLVLTVIVVAHKLYCMYWKSVPEQSLVEMWVPIKANLQLYADEVRDNIALETLESVTYDVTALHELCEKISALLCEGDEAIANDMQKTRDKLGRLVSELVVARPKTFPVDQYYVFLEDSYKDNFSETLIKTFDVQYNKLYEFLGTTREEGVSLNVRQIAALIDTKMAELKNAGHADADVDSLERQLGYMFQSEAQKELYDAFVSGKDEVATKTIPQEQRELLERTLEEVTQILTKLDELIREVKSGGWVEIDSPAQ